MPNTTMTEITNLGISVELFGHQSTHSVRYDTTKNPSLTFKGCTMFCFEWDEPVNAEEAKTYAIFTEG
jgi:hypothetical protein